MPTVSCYKEELFDQIGKRFTEDEFDALCFEFGIELDDVTSEKEMIEKEKGAEFAKGLSEEVVYKIDIPANRYDLLCVEGIARAFRVYLLMEEIPRYTITHPKNKISLTIKPEVASVRPYAVSAVLRNITFTPGRYASFIDLQDKLHQNIGRRRTLIAIGTHDLDTVTPPFTYEARPQKDISFVPLSESKEFRVDELFHYYKNVKENCHLKEFLPITENSPVHPVIYDSKRTLLSLPPIINGEHSKIKLETKNVLIECTGTDPTKLNIVLNIMLSMFAHYCEDPFTIESVDVIGSDGVATAYPKLDDVTFNIADAQYVNKLIGIDMEPAMMADILKRMQLNASFAPSTGLTVMVPPTRADILHPCDIAEDIAIAFGYNNIKKTVPKLGTAGRPLPINKVSDQVREVVAQAGYLEVLTWILVSLKENFAMLQRKDDGSCVTIAKPRPEEFSVVRTTLVPGLLKTMEANKAMNMPVNIFECGDVVVQDTSRDTGSRNIRRLAALHCGQTSGFEQVHSLVDRLMAQSNIVFKGEEVKGDNRRVYEIRPSEDPAFFPKRRADIFIDNVKAGVFGIVHPGVLENFKLGYPCSVMEIDLEVLCDLDCTYIFSKSK